MFDYRQFACFCMDKHTSQTSQLVPVSDTYLEQFKSDLVNCCYQYHQSKRHQNSLITPIHIRSLKAHECLNFLVCHCLADLHGMNMRLVITLDECAMSQGCTSHYADAHQSLIYASKSSGGFPDASISAVEIALTVSACLHFSVSLVINRR